MLHDYIKDDPEAVWPLVTKWGAVRNRDIRAGVAVCVLEHILEFHFEEYFPRIERLIRGGVRRMALTLSMCWHLGKASDPSNSERIKRLVDAHLHRRRA